MLLAPPYVAAEVRLLPPASLPCMAGTYSDIWVGIRDALLSIALRKGTAPSGSFPKTGGYLSLANSDLITAFLGP